MNDIERACAAFRTLLLEQQARIAGINTERTDYTKKPTVTIGLVDGDGIGPIITEQAVRVLEALLADELARGSIVLRRIRGLTIENRMMCWKKSWPATCCSRGLRRRPWAADWRART